MVDQVEFRGRHGGRGAGVYRSRQYGNNYGYRNRRHYGRNAGIGLGAAIVGGVILSEAARSAHRRDNGSDWSRCAVTYRSFERSTGMYTGNDGVRRTCPYLN